MTSRTNNLLNKYDVTWIILAGGQASRMGGIDKGLVNLNNQFLINYVFENLKRQGAEIMINANRNKEIYQQYGFVFSDTLTGFQGPLGGIHAALSLQKSIWYGFVPCDCPNLPDQLLLRMYDAIRPESEIIVAKDAHSIQPVVTMMKQDIFNKLDDFLTNGNRKIALLYEQCTTDFVDFSDFPNAFINLNTNEELKKYGALL